MTKLEHDNIVPSTPIAAPTEMQNGTVSIDGETLPMTDRMGQAIDQTLPKQGQVTKRNEPDGSLECLCPI